MKEIFLGEDGKPSGRRIFGAVCFIAGFAAGFIGMVLPGDWTRFIPLGGFLFTGLFLWGMVTVQNVQDIVKTAKGDK